MNIIDVSMLHTNELHLVDKTGEDNHYVLVNIKNDFNLSIDAFNSLFISILLDSNDINLYITGKGNHDSNLVIYVADFSKGNVTLLSNINLDGNNSYYEWHLASLSNSDFKKKFEVSVNQIATNTSALLDNYGVCKDQSKLEFSGTCHICNGANHTTAHQNAKIVVFDEKCDAIAKPILKIDENDVVASHAATVGKINDDQLFYLLSRGLSESVAKKLITYGYLKPICKGFNDEIASHITDLIEGEI